MIQYEPIWSKYGQKWSKTVQTCPNMSKMVQNGPIWSNIVQNGQKLSKIVLSGPKWSEWSKRVQNVQKWSKMVRNGPKWYNLSKIVKNGKIIFFFASVLLSTHAERVSVSSMWYFFKELDWLTSFL